MTNCKRCGKPTKNCMCYTESDLESFLREYQKKKKAGTLTDEEVVEGVKKRKPKDKNELLDFLNKIGLNQAARDRVIRKVTKNAKRAGRDFLHNLVDDLIPEEEDIIIEAECKVECPECGEMVKDLKNHKCKN